VGSKGSGVVWLLGGHRFWGVKEEPLVEDGYFLSDVVYQVVVFIPERQEGVGLVAFAEFSKSPDVLGVFSMV